MTDYIIEVVDDYIPRTNCTVRYVGPTSSKVNETIDFAYGEILLTAKATQQDLRLVS